MKTNTILALTLTAVLSLGTLGACTPQETSESQLEPTATQTENTGTAAEQQEQGTEKPSETSSSIETEKFSLTLPAYWDGKVEWSTTTTAEGYPEVQVYLSGRPEAQLIRLAAAQGEEAPFAGDISTHLVHQQAKDGWHIELWSTNWPYLALATPGYQGLSEREIRELVDLSTGGAVSYLALVEEGATAEDLSEETLFAENNFIQEQIVAGLKLK